MSRSDKIDIFVIMAERVSDYNSWRRGYVWVDEVMIRFH